MAVLQMQKISICALKKDRKAILEQIQAMGVLEVTQFMEDEDGFEKMETASARMNFEKTAQLADNALAVLEEYVPEKHSMLDGLAGKGVIDREELLQAASEKEEILQVARRLIAGNKEIAEASANITKLQTQVDALTPWSELDVPMTYVGTAKTAFMLGTMEPGLTLEDIYTRVNEQNPELPAVDIHLVHSDKDAVYLAVICLKTDAEKVEETLRGCGFVRPAQPANKIPKMQIASLEEEMVVLRQLIEDVKAGIQKYEDYREPLQKLSDYFRIRAEKYEVLGTLPQSGRTFVLSGYTPKRAVPAIKKTIGDVYNCVVDVEEIGEEEEAPTILSNNGFSDSVEGVVASYGLPQKGEVDPTTIMSFFYVFFFGMMLSDAAYGAILAGACFILLKKFPRMSAGMHKSIKMFMYCGISTLIWGVLFGGYFGNVVDIVSQTFFGKTVSVPALWFVPLDDPMRLLVYSMLFGIIHLFVGLGMKGYMCLKDGKVLDFFCDVVLWYCLLIGLILMFLPTEIFASIAQSNIVFPDAVNMLAKALAIIGAVGLLLMSGRASKNPGLRIALGAYDLYNITGWLSDVLSYSRLLALGLATGVIASVINQMASMLGGGIIGVIGFIIIFIVGHTLNLAINLLGAYVHTNRLQFVEFFGKFYEGGGKPFEPFAPDTKYVDIKEETLS